MCTTCGCSDDALPTLTTSGGTTHPISAPDPHAHAHDHHHPHDHAHDHAHDHHHAHAHPHDPHPHSHSHPPSHSHPHPPSHSHSHPPSHSHSPSPTHDPAPSRTITLEAEILAKNSHLAAHNRGWLEGRGILALNLTSSPGAGKTTLLERTILDLRAELPLGVVEGDQATANDADRIRAAGCPVVQINTGTGCHLDAAMIAAGLRELAPPRDSLLFVENVGNLVCPALFDLGEHCMVVILSVTEGEDKPLKYPHMFRAASLMILNKIDLLPYVAFDVERCVAYARQINPDLEVLRVSATSGSGIEGWYAWLRARRARQSDALGATA